jgi:acyl dehydratase
MGIDRQRLLDWDIPEVRQTYTERDSVLYALGIGVGMAPADDRELRYVLEERPRVFPTMGLVLGYPGLWLSDPALDVDWKRMLHGEQSIVIHRPLPAAGSVIGKTRVVDVVDKGAGRGAVVYTERDVVEASTGELMCRLSSASILRADGGFGGPDGPVRAPAGIPPRAPDHSVYLRTSAQAALIYRLSGDRNPLHVDPEMASAAGFERPILHGLCTFASVARSLLLALCPSDPDRLSALAVRFTSPVYPGETIRTEIWIDGDDIAFRSFVDDRNMVVLNNGSARIDLAGIDRVGGRSSWGR